MGNIRALNIRSNIPPLAECPFTAVVALVSCAANAHLYEHLRHRCSGAMLFTLFESTCPRPPSDIGVGIAHLNSVGQLTALLADVGLALAQRWPSVTVMHQTELGSSRAGQPPN